MSQAHMNNIHIYIYNREGEREKKKHMAVSSLFVTTESTETLNSTIVGVTCFVLPSLSQKIHPKSYRLAKQTSLHNSITRYIHVHIRVCVYIYIYTYKYIVLSSLSLLYTHVCIYIYICRNPHMFCRRRCYGGEATMIIILY